MEELLERSIHQTLTDKVHALADRIGQLEADKRSLESRLTRAEKKLNTIAMRCTD